MTVRGPATVIPSDALHSAQDTTKSPVNNQATI